MKSLQFILLLVLTSSCAQIMRTPTNHFMTPFVQKDRWNGEINAIFSNNTNITLVNDITTNPPSRTASMINTGYGLADLFLPITPNGNVSLTVFPQIALFCDVAICGIKWQVIGDQSGSWPVAIQANTGSKTTSLSSSTNNSTAESKMTSNLAGISIGYRTQSFGVPYFSFIYEDHAATTRVQNSFGTFNYTDAGYHRNYSFGIAKESDGLSASLEVTGIEILWNRAQPAWQSSTGVSLGYRW